MDTSVTLICGLPGTGKTTYAKTHLARGVVYDLDAIAAAFRLKMPHEEHHDASMHMANDLLDSFVERASQYTTQVFIIRTAPDVTTLQRVKPRHVVICMQQHVRRPYSEGAMKRLMDVEKWCKQNHISVEYVY